MFLGELAAYSLQSLRIFAHVSAVASVNEAARSLGISQPAVSLQIHNLEKHLGFRLFERKGRKNVLTTRGQMFRQKLLPQLERLELLLTDAKAMEREAKPELSLGSVEGIGEFWLWTRFNEFSRSRKNLRLLLQIDHNAKLENLLSTGRVSVVITTRRPEDPRIISQVLMDEKLVPIGTKAKISELKRVLAASKPDERCWEKIAWLGYGAIDNLDPWTLRWLENIGIIVDRRFKHAHVVNSYAVIKQLLVEGAGICVAPAHAFAAELKRKSLHCLESKAYPALRNRLYISYREDSLNETHRAFQEWIIKTARDYDKNGSGAGSP